MLVYLLYRYVLCIKIFIIFEIGYMINLKKIYYLKFILKVKMFFVFDGICYYIFFVEFKSIY